MMIRTQGYRLQGKEEKKNRDACDSDSGGGGQLNTLSVNPLGFPYRAGTLRTYHKSSHGDIFKLVTSFLFYLTLS